MTGLSEKDVDSQAVYVLKASGVRLFRNNIGAAKLGGFWVQFGVGGKGGGDHIGYLPVRITPAMVGKTVAVFVAAEMKREKKGVITDDQKAFVDSVKSAGGIAGFMRSWQEARSLVTEFLAHLGAP